MVVVGERLLGYRNWGRWRRKWELKMILQYDNRVVSVVLVVVMIDMVYIVWGRWDVQPWLIAHN